jgi:hypothetical protein
MCAFMSATPNCVIGYKVDQDPTQF